MLAYWFLSYVVPSVERSPGESCRAKSDTKLKIPESSLPYRDYTLDELKPYNGADKEHHILIAVDLRVYDVSSARHHYGPGGSYAILAGRDASRALATHAIPKSVRSLEGWDELNDLSVSEREALNEWVSFFDSKYPRVGTLVPLHAWSGSGQEDQPEIVHGAIVEDFDLNEQYIIHPETNKDL